MIIGLIIFSIVGLFIEQFDDTDWRYKYGNE